MRIVRPIASIDNAYQKDAYITFWIGISFSLLVVAVFAAVVINILASRETENIKAAVNACRNLESTLTLADCIRAAR